MYRFELPDIGEGVVEAEILEWKVQEGDWIELDQIMVELMTDKAEIEIPSPRAGRVHRIHFQPGEIAPVGAVLIEIDEGTERQADAARPARVEPEQPAPDPPAPPLAETRPQSQPAAAHPPSMPERPRSRQKASESPADVDESEIDAVPAVRELARRLDVDLKLVHGTGPGGRIMRRDVEQFRSGGVSPMPVRDEVLPPAEEDADDWERQPLRGLRRAIARRMSRARRTAAHFTYVEEVDMTELLALARGGEEGTPRSPLAFIAHAAVRALADYVALNSSVDDDRQEIIFKKKVHLGIAAATEGGLVVPVIRDAARLSVAELSEAIEELAGKARESRLTPEELRGGTFTISSLGKLGGIMSTPILNHPEVAILGVNAIREVLRLDDGEPRPRNVMNLSMSVDHRVTDGLVCAQFIQEVKRILEGVDFPDLSDEGESR
jgi:pyruvate dehydrogenase E2 component (dihydrolipoamide acetyltransferase)